MRDQIYQTAAGAEVGTWSSEAGYLQELAVASDDGASWNEETIHNVDKWPLDRR